MIIRQTIGDYHIEYKKFPILNGQGMSAALVKYSLKDMGMVKGKQSLEIEGGTIRKQAIRINGTDQESMDILLQDLKTNENEAKQFNNPTPDFRPNISPPIRMFKGETIRLDRIEQ